MLSKRLLVVLASISIAVAPLLSSVGEASANHIVKIMDEVLTENGTDILKLTFTDFPVFDSYSENTTIRISVVYVDPATGQLFQYRSLGEPYVQEEDGDNYAVSYAISDGWREDKEYDDPYWGGVFIPDVVGDVVTFELSTSEKIAGYYVYVYFENGEKTVGYSDDYYKIFEREGKERRMDGGIQGLSFSYSTAWNWMSDGNTILLRPEVEYSSYTTDDQNAGPYAGTAIIAIQRFSGPSPVGGVLGDLVWASDSTGEKTDGEVTIDGKEGAFFQYIDNVAPGVRATNLKFVTVSIDDDTGYIFMLKGSPEGFGRYLADFDSLVSSARFSDVSMSSFSINSQELDGRTYAIHGRASSVVVSSATINPEMSVHLDLSGSSGGTLELTMPKEMIDGVESVMSDNGQEITFAVLEETNESTTITIEIPHDTESVEIFGATVVPEFPIAAGILAAVIGGLAMMGRTHIFRLW